MTSKKAADDQEHHGDKYLGEYHEQTKSTRSNISKISKARAEIGGKPKKSKGLKILEDEDIAMEDSTSPVPEEQKEKGI